MEIHGITAERVDLLPLTASNSDHLATYTWMDISLDPWPYAGTTTTCESLYMGVPVISLAGEPTFFTDYIILERKSLRAVSRVDYGVGQSVFVAVRLRVLTVRGTSRSFDLSDLTRLPLSASSYVRGLRLR